MIDWVSAKIICNHDPNKLSNGIIASLDRDGNTEWLTNKKTTVEGSYSTKIQIQSVTDTQIYISGNPTKFLQGHNLFGSNDLVSIMGKFFDELLKKEELGLCPDPFQYANIKDGHYELSRVDVNETWHLNNEKEEYYCPECNKEFYARASLPIRDVRVIKGRTDGKTDRYVNP